MSRVSLTVVLIAFIGITARALWEHGYWGIFEPHLQSWAGIQVLLDLAIALGLFLIWMWRDARASARNPWPWLVATLATGSIGALLYLLTRRSNNGVVPPSNR